MFFPVRRVEKPAGGRNRSLGIAACGLLALSLAGCSGSPEPVSRAPGSEQAPAAQTPETSPAPQTPPQPEAPRPSTAQEIPAEGNGAKKDDPNVVVVDPGEDGNGRVSLTDAARAERERRAKAGPPVAVITNKNLPEYARKGQITIGDSKEKTAAGAAPAAPAAPAEPVRDEQYWRSRALEIRSRWRELADEIQELETSAARLRQRFYGEDDPHVRDTQIKPEWDRALDRLREARVEVETTKRELAQFLEEGRVAGVLDGWLREGTDLEPEEEQPAKTNRPAQSIEPPVMEPPPAGEEIGEDGGA